MAETTSKRIQLIRLLVPLAVIFLLLHRIESGDFVSDATRPAVVAIIKMAGFTAADNGAELLAGNRLVVPWTRDCAGLNILALMLALTLWSSRTETRYAKVALRLFIAVALGFFANICRILTLIVYRWALWPDVESPQLHYFIGFLWILPFLPLVIPLPRGERMIKLAEALYMVAVLALLAPFVSSPGGNTVALAALVMLAGSRFNPANGFGSILVGILWVGAGLFIGTSGMESFWTPWLLLCPAFVNARVLFSPAGPVLLAGSVPLFAMQPGASWVVLAAVALAVWRLTRPVITEATAVGGMKPAVFSVLLFIPFAASIASTVREDSPPPPAGLMTQQIGPNAYRVRVVGHPPDIETVWYSSYGDGRHHTLKVCMRFRGVDLKPVEGWPGLFTDGHVWMREFFIQDRVMTGSYQTYLLRTLRPGSSAGIHIIATAERAGMTPGTFHRDAGQLADIIQATSAR